MQPTYIKHFATESKAASTMRSKNRCNRVKSWCWVMADGPDNDFVVLDIRTAIEMGLLYSWAA